MPYHRIITIWRVGLAEVWFGWLVGLGRGMCDSKTAGFTSVVRQLRQLTKTAGKTAELRQLVSQLKCPHDCFKVRVLLFSIHLNPFGGRAFFYSLLSERKSSICQKSGLNELQTPPNHAENISPHNIYDRGAFLLLSIPKTVKTAG